MLLSVQRLHRMLVHSDKQFYSQGSGVHTVIFPALRLLSPAMNWVLVVNVCSIILLCNFGVPKNGCYMRAYVNSLALVYIQPHFNQVYLKDMVTYFSSCDTHSQLVRYFYLYTL